jgi:DNA-binding PadR family transcriptional regulator
MKPKIPNQKKLYAELKKRLDAYTLLIDGVYNSLNDDAARLALSTGYSGGVPFRWKDYPKTEELLLDLRTRFVKEMRAVVHASTSKEWEKSNEAQDAIANGALKCYKMKQGDKQRKYYRNNSAALEAFQKRRTAGLNLSQRLWNQSADYQSGLEAAISVGIEKGMSAVTLSKRLSQYLNDYPKLRKDYKELYGTATDIRDCEYNSARLARNEINMAYRSAEQERWKQFDFVVGKRIKTSSVHPDRMPHGDICDTLAGDYPKDFEWSGWHISCMCFEVPIMKTDDEFWNEDEDFKSENEVEDVPDNFKEWVKDNQDRIEAAEQRGTQPYFVRDNKNTVNDILGVNDKPTAQDVAKHNK